MLKSVVKFCLRIGFYIALLPSFLIYCGLRPLLGKDRAFVEIYEWLAFLPGICGRLARETFLHMVIARAGENWYIGTGTLFSHADIEIGTNVYIGPACSIGRVIIEDNVLIAGHTSIINGGRQHSFDDDRIPIRDQPGTYPLVRIGQGSWIGERAVVMADVGDHSIVGAGAVVTKPVPPYAIVVGNPARILRYRHPIQHSSYSTARSSYLEEQGGIYEKD